MPERLGRGEQFVEVEHAQQPRAPECGVIDRVGAGQRPGVGERRLGAERLPSGFDHQYGFRTRRGPRRRHELACVADGFDVEQNGAGCAIHGEVIEKVGKIDVDAVADRDYRGKSNSLRRRPFDQSRSNGAGLGDKREIAGRRHRGRKARVELDPRHQHTQAIGADKAHPCRARNRPALIGKRAGAVTEPRSENDADSGTFRRRRRDGGWNDCGAARL